MMTERQEADYSLLTVSEKLFIKELEF